MGCPTTVDLYIFKQIMVLLKIILIFWYVCVFACVSINTHGKVHTYPTRIRWSQLVTNYSMFFQITNKLESLGRGLQYILHIVRKNKSATIEF
jgi:hypothetical protein